MPATYEPIATTTLGSSSSSITLSNIPSSYTDLRLVFVPRGAGVEVRPFLEFNGDTNNNYSRVTLQGNGGSVQSTRSNSFSYIASNTNISTSGVGVYTADILGYSGSTFKPVILNSSADNNASPSGVDVVMGTWRNTAALSSIRIWYISSFGTGTTATLYGILKA